MFDYVFVIYYFDLKIIKFLVNFFFLQGKRWTNYIRTTRECVGPSQWSIFTLKILAEPLPGKMSLNNVVPTIFQQYQWFK